MEKSPEAFRTISEVADFLDTPAHVLRFWESRFPQIRPVKRAGGRRYYRPGDVALLSGIKRLLHDEGMTIRGVQKILREQGIRHVAGLVAIDMPESDVEAILAAEFGPKNEPTLPPIEAQTAQIISLEAALVRHEATRAEPIQPELWPADPVDLADTDADAPETAWPADPEDDVEAPFIEADENQDAVQPIGLVPYGATGTPADAAPATPDVADGTADITDTVAETPQSTIAARLRHLHPGYMADRQDELRAIRSRMIALRDRLAQGARRRAK
jgi:DNA-binding transcriptional MerR regulator